MNIHLNNRTFMILYYPQDIISLLNFVGLLKIMGLPESAWTLLLTTYTRNAKPCGNFRPYYHQFGWIYDIRIYITTSDK